jgi:transmembrane serine protease 3
MTKLVFSLIFLTASVALAMGQSCGVPSSPMRANRKHQDDQRIVGGVEARPGSHPWIVSMQTGGSHFCGGSLIRVCDTKEETDIVVTAAHCVYDGFSGVTLSAGAHDLTSPPNGQQTVRGVQAVYHPKYNPDTTLNDIAIIKLDKPIKFSSTVKPICLPAAAEKVADSIEGTVAGWGLTQEGGFDTSSVLMQVGVPSIPSTQCSADYRAQGINIDSTAMLCAGYKQGGKDSCQGDSGGPFVFKKGQSYVLQGVVSFGVGCARAGLPGVYARVSNYIGWINEQVKALSVVKA